jgi:ABC-type transport system substrate-binding protein
MTRIPPITPVMPAHAPAPTSVLGRRRFLAGAAGMSALVGLGVPRAARARTPDTLIFGLSSYPPSLAPFQNSGTAAGTVKVQMFRGLLGYDNRGEIRPEVAETFEQQGPTVLQFKLRANAKFHNGDAVTAEDVKYSFEQIVAERSTAFLKADFAIVERIEVVDAKTVKLHLKQPSATFPFQLASWYAPVISAKSTAQNPIGCGPYTIGDIERGTRVEMTRFDGFYRQGRPKLKNLRFVAYADENLRVAALEAGDVDIIEYVPWPNMEAIQRNPNLRLETVDGPFMYLNFNVSQGPFQNVKLRQAAAYAINREDVVRAAFSGRGSVLEGIPLPPGTPYFNEGAARYWRRDLAKARALLAEGGQPNGFQATLLSTAQYGMHKDTAEVVQQSLREIGVQVQLNMPDWATRVTLGNRGQYDFAVMGSGGDFNDPDSLTAFIGGGQAAYTRSFGYNNERINALLAQGRAELDVERRRQIYAEMEQVALADAPMVGIAWRSQGYAMQRYVEGFKNLPVFLTFYSGMTIEDVSI